MLGNCRPAFSRFRLITDHRQHDCGQPQRTSFAFLQRTDRHTHTHKKKSPVRNSRPFWNVHTIQSSANFKALSQICDESRWGGGNHVSWLGRTAHAPMPDGLLRGCRFRRLASPRRDAQSSTSAPLLPQSAVLSPGVGLLPPVWLPRLFGWTFHPRHKKDSSQSSSKPTLLWRFQFHRFNKYSDW